MLDDCGAVALVASAAMADVVAGPRPLTHVRCGCRRTASSPASSATTTCWPPSRPAPLDDEREGREMLYSSGTTGRPEGRAQAAARHAVRRSRGARRCRSREGIGMFGVGPGAVYLSPAPLYHSAPLVYSMAMQRLGATVVVMEKFDPRQCLELIERYRVTHAQFVPTMFVRMLKLPDERARAATTCRACRSSSTPPRRARSTVKRQMIDWWGPIIHEYYSRHRGHRRRRSSRRRSGSRTRARSAGRCSARSTSSATTASELPPGEVGRRVLRAAAGRSSTTTTPRRPRRSRNDARLATVGDIGYLDDDGYLYLTDRKAYMIISGGVNIYPQEAENVLVDHPAVADVAVFGVPDDEMGEAVKAVVQPVDSADAGPELERGAARVLPRAAGALQVPAHRRLRRRAAPRPHRQALQAAAARPLLAGPRIPRHLIFPPNFCFARAQTEVTMGSC